jgi:hypothetical protein
MPQVLTTRAIIACPHGGMGTSVPTDLPPKWFVDNGVVLLDGDAGVLSCTFPVPCVGYQLRSLGLNASTVMGRKVMLVTDFTQSFTGYPLTLVEAHHVVDDSTPVPIPLGGAAPVLPPELQSIDQPTVTAAPSALAFSLSAFGTTGLPTALPMTFTLQSQFPRRWLLSMLNAPTAQHRDITNGEPPNNIIVVPSGGAWSTPVLIVTVTLTGAFMATLAPGLHYFVLTAINFRGKSQYAQAELTVST